MKNNRVQIQLKWKTFYTFVAEYQALVASNRG